MTPSQLSARLRQIASAIENSKRPSRSRVASELRRAIAAVASPEVSSIKWLRRPGDEPDSLPLFHVTGTFEGQQFDCRVTLELDGRHADFDYGQGFNPDTVGLRGDFEEDVMQAIYNSPEFQAAVQEYKSAAAKHW